MGGAVVGVAVVGVAVVGVAVVGVAVVGVAVVGVAVVGVAVVGVAVVGVAVVGVAVVGVAVVGVAVVGAGTEDEVSPPEAWSEGAAETLVVLEDPRVLEVSDVLEATELPEESAPGAPEGGATVVDVVPASASPPTGFEPRLVVWRTV